VTEAQIRDVVLSALGRIAPEADYRKLASLDACVAYLQARHGER
jgi:hypothetical protein